MRTPLALLAALLASGCLSVVEHEPAPATQAKRDWIASDTILWPAWAARGPSAADFHRVYPVGAKADNVEGIAYLRCTIEQELTLGCEIDQEAPAGYGFGAAAIQLSREFAIRTDHDVARPGAKVRLPIRFALEN
ncbi:MAG: hypothetical protein RIR33_685 [Pseudomonadota bacterium]